jgi:oligopeptide/dipeptide ABC transporter ATP-binding protein
MKTLPALVPAGERLNSIAGMVPQPGRWPTGCRFVNRCPVAIPECGLAAVPLIVDAKGSVRCILYNGNGHQTHTSAVQNRREVVR